MANVPGGRLCTGGLRCAARWPTARGHMTLKEQIHDMGRRALEASRGLAQLPAERKNAILLAMADGLESEAPALLAANEKDLAAAQAKGLSSAMLDRLTLNPKRIAAM